MSGAERPDRLSGTAVRARMVSWRVWVPACATTLVLLAAAWFYAGGATVRAQVLAAFSSAWMIPAFLCLLANQLVGALRLLLAADLPLTASGVRRATRINVVQQAAVRVLPLRLSELVWLLLVTYTFAVPVSRATGAYLHVRIWDITVLLLLAAVALPGLLLARGGDGGMVFAFAIGGLCVGLAVLLCLPNRGVLRLAERLSRALRRARPARALRAFALRAIRTFVLAARGRRGLHAGLAVLGWSAGLGSLALIVKAIRVELGVLEVLLALVILVISSAIPLPALGLASSAEVGFAAALALMGVQGDAATGAAVALGVVHAGLSLVLLAFWFGAVELGPWARPTAVSRRK